LEHFCGSKIEIFKQDFVRQYDNILDCLAMRIPAAAAAPGGAATIRTEADAGAGAAATVYLEPWIRAPSSE